MQLWSSFGRVFPNLKPKSEQDETYAQVISGLCVHRDTCFANPVGGFLSLLPSLQHCSFSIEGLALFTYQYIVGPILPNFAP